VVIKRTVAGLWLADRLSRRNVESMRSRQAKPMTTLGQPPRKGKLDSVVRQVLGTIYTCAIPSIHEIPSPSASYVIARGAMADLMRCAYAWPEG